MRALGIACLMVAVVASDGCSRRKPSTTEVDSKPIENPGPTAKKGRGTFTIGKATTYFTGPLDADGRIDYVAAVNDRLSKGVSPEHNANVAIWRVIGPKPPGDEKIPPGFFERLGMPVPPATGEYFVGLKAYCDRHAPGHEAAAFEAMTKMANRPWTAHENATLSGWLQTNDKQLNTLREAVKRPKYYNPLLPERREKGLGQSILPGLSAGRELANALLTRAMLYLGHNQPDEAWKDLLTCHRLGRQIGQGETLIEGLVAIAIEQLTCRGDIAYLDRVNSDAKTLESCLRDLLALQRVRIIAEQIDVVERFYMLDSIMQFDRNDVSQEHFYGEDLQPYKHGLNNEALNGIEWNPALEVANKGYDQLVVILREKDRVIRVEELSRLLSQTRPHYVQLVGGHGKAEIERAGSAKERGRVFGQMLFAGVIPLLVKVNDAADRVQQHFDTVAVAFALTWYQRVNGRYPDSLDKLAPTYLKTVPGDVFSGKELIYQPNANGFLLYGVGPNGKDDGGRWFDDQPPGDDVVVRIPLPPAR